MNPLDANVISIPKPKGYMKLLSYGINFSLVDKILKIRTIDQIEENPWLLYTDNFLSFKDTDNLALDPDKFNNSERSFTRRKCYIKNYFDNISCRSGEVYVPLDKFTLDIKRDMRMKMSHLKKYVKVIRDQVTSNELYEKEEYIKRVILFLIDQKSVIAPYTNIEQLSEKQNSAVKTALENHISIITGSPGTGKTSIIRNILTRITDYILLAPTGAAAKQIERATGSKAHTIHKYLLWLENYNESVRIYQLYKWLKGTKFQKNYQYIIIDEASMVDIHLVHSLLYNVYDEMINDTSQQLVIQIPKLILIGDVDQLPSIGPGQVLKDLINSNVIPTTKLTKNYRQGEGSGIITVSRKIIKGKSPKFNDDCLHFETDADDIIALIPMLIAEYNLEVENSIFLSPQKSTGIGTIAINNLLQNYYNLEGEPVYKNKSMELRIGDPVIQQKNDYKKGVFNGSMGYIVGCDNKKIGVVFEDDNTIYYQKNEITQLLNLCYCMTVHKSQGKQFENVVIIAHSAHGHMFNRNLLYTAITRAQKKCIIIGDQFAIKLTLKRSVNRRTNLSSFMIEQP